MKTTRKTRAPEEVAAKTQAPKWEFKARFRRHAFGWKSQPAIQRVKEAVAEIKRVARKDAVLAAEGAVNPPRTALPCTRVRRQLLGRHRHGSQQRHRRARTCDR